MRVDNAAEKQLIVADEELSSLEDIVHVQPMAQYLNVAFNRLASLDGLQQLSELRSLNVSHNSLTSLREVSTLVHLRVLKCSGNQINDLSWLSGLCCLEELWLRDNRVANAQLAQLQSLAALRTLVIHPNPCTELDNYVHVFSFRAILLWCTLGVLPLFSRLRVCVCLCVRASKLAPLCACYMGCRLTIVKILPWLERVDTVIVTDELRMEAQHIVERADLPSSATDDASHPLTDVDPQKDKSTARFFPPKAPKPQKPQKPSPHLVGDTHTIPVSHEATPVSDEVLPHTSGSTATSPAAKVPAKSKKQLATEAFLRNFPIQEFIPVGKERATTPTDTQQPSTDHEPELPPQAKTPSATPPDVSACNPEDTSVIPPHPKSVPTSEEAGVSALMGSVQMLPSFKEKPKKLRLQLLPGSRKSKRTKTAKTNLSSNQESTASAPSFHQAEELHRSYPNSTVAAVQVRCDGSAVARWPSGSVAVSVDPERDGFRIYTAHRDGQLALSFDAAGVGFLNAYPSGRTLISTTSTGDGLLFDSESGAILRQWDGHGRLRDGACQPVTALGDEPDGSLLCRLSEDIAVRVQLESPQQDNDDASSEPLASRNPILLQVYFSTPPDIRHVFVNRANQAELSPIDACDYALGKAVSKEDKIRAARAKKPPPVEHVDLLSSIRAAVASL